MTASRGFFIAKDSAAHKHKVLIVLCDKVRLILKNYYITGNIKITMAQYLTREGLQKLKNELHELKTVKIPENIKLIKYAAAEGDLKENAGYHDARERKTWLLRRIEELENAINDAVIYEKKDSDKVQNGSIVKILMDGKKETYEIVAPTEADILKNKMSYQSPLGQQLINRKAGEEFNYEIKDKKMKVKVLSIK